MKQAVSHLKRADPVLKRLIGRIGPCRIEYREPDFTALARAIVFQQLSGSVARAIWGRLEAAAGDGAFSPEGVRRLPVERLRSAGLSQRKAEYLLALAEAAAAGSVDFATLPSLADEAVLEMLTSVRGIGRWTGQMFLIFALRRPDVLPTGDLGVRTAVRKAYELEDLPLAAELERLAEPWRPYRSVASWYLWRSLDGKAEM